jgi:hypothetical protein
MKSSLKFTLDFQCAIWDMDRLRSFCRRPSRKLFQSHRS